MLGNIKEDKIVLFAMLDDWRDQYGYKKVLEIILEWLKG
jgi:hypothetical protein